MTTRYGVNSPVRFFGASLMFRFLPQSMSLLIIAALIASTPGFGHPHRCDCPATANNKELQGCATHSHGACEAHSHHRRASAEQLTVPGAAKHGATEESCPCCPTCPAHGTCAICGGAQSMALAVNWTPPTANTLTSRTCIEAMSGYEFLLCSELLRPPTA